MGVVFQRRSSHGNERGREVDVIKLVAAKCYNDKPVEQVTDEERKKAKQALYGVIYGIGADEFAKQLSISRSEAQQLQKMIKTKFTGIQILTDRIVADAMKTSFVKTIKGRRRVIKKLAPEERWNRGEVEKGKRQAFNATIQGSAADIIKIASINVSDNMVAKTKEDERYDQVRLVAQVRRSLHRIPSPNEPWLSP